MDAIASELHRPARRNYPRRKVYLPGLYQADLVEMQPYSKINKGYKYILTMINCLSKVAFAVPLKNKSGPEVAKAIAPILAKYKMTHLQTDQGTDFFNKHVNVLMKKHKINHYHSYSELKASIIERLNRTIKTKMYKLFTARGSYEWLSILPKIIKSYNNTKHRTIGMKPKDVTRKHYKDILKRINSKSPKQKTDKQKFKVGDVVRISKVKRIFKKGYLANWSEELFTVYAIKPTIPVTYMLQDSRNEILKGNFYSEELIKSRTGNVYLIDKILKRKGDSVFVSWRGFDSSHNSWIKVNALTR